MDFLSENDIKRAALRFLKTYYKYRPRVGETRAQLDMVADDGTIADGHISFPVALGENFLATFEATSYATANEVKYKLRNARLWWDSCTFAALVGTVGFLVLHGREYITVGAEKVFITVLLLLTCLITLALFYRLLFRGLRAYRQIYAVEQFKLYDADEQWVVVSEEVFEDREDKYLVELKRQCVLNGFGLLLVDRDHDAQQIITPAQVPMDGKRRKPTVFRPAAEQTPIEPEEDEGEEQSATEALISDMRGIGDNLGHQLGWDRADRFRYNFYFQLAIISSCLLILTVMMWREMGKAKVVVVNESIYKRKLRKRMAELKKEGDFYIIDEGFIVDSTGEITDYDLGGISSYDEDEVARWYTRHHQDSLLGRLDNPFDREKALDSLRGLLALQDSLAALTGKKKKGDKKTSRIPSYCQVYTPWRGRRYILKDGIYSNRPAAQRRVEQINKAGCLAGILHGGCFLETGPYYVVYVDGIYLSGEKVKAALPYFDQLLKDQGYSSGDLQAQRVTVKR